MAAQYYKNKLKYNFFKKIVLGSEVFSGSWGINFNVNKISKILKFASMIGVREIDTAPTYGKKKHEVEKKIGEILFKENLKFSICTKFIIDKNLLKNRDNLLKNIKSQLEGSLKSLKIDTIDNYFFHSGTDEEFFNDDVWEFLVKKKKDGLIKNLCLSLKHDLVRKNTLKQLDFIDQYQIDKISTVCNLYSRESLKKVIPFCKKKNLTIYGRIPLAKGLLTGKYKDLTKFNKLDPRINNLEMTKKIITFSKKIKNLSAKKSVLWSIKHCDKVIIGFKNINQIKSLIDSD
jgi:aryl-alcohol dehydrogenase-like predicted oxidoreductase